ncbi:hypothetical protein C8J57DRAFT_663587 [Mycena rebaudengoi]|nr:hypothetical protein C8J57DRAFT_663587 [Mycena rebaudengoi]
MSPASVLALVVVLREAPEVAGASDTGTAERLCAARAGGQLCEYAMLLARLLPTPSTLLLSVTLLPPASWEMTDEA